MKWTMVCALLAACSSKGDGGATKPAPPLMIGAGPPADADPRMVAVPQPVPPGPYIVAYDCMHSNMPFGEGGWFRNQSADLSTKKWTVLEVTTTGKPEPANAPPPEPTVTDASPAVAFALAKAIDVVLTGGPYRAEYPVPEGAPCTLSITTATSQPVFRIEKADTAEHDAVSELIVLFRAKVGT